MSQISYRRMVCLFSLLFPQFYGAGASKNYNKRLVKNEFLPRSQSSEISTLILLCACSQRVHEIQRQLSQRCIELLDLPARSSMYILDVGCGSVCHAPTSGIRHTFVAPATPSLLRRVSVVKH